MLEVNLGENYFNFLTGSPGNFPGKRKSTGDCRRDQRRKPPGKGVPTTGKHGVGSVAPGDPTGAQEHRKEECPGHHPFLLSVEPYPSQNIYSLLQISLS